MENLDLAGLDPPSDPKEKQKSPWSKRPGGLRKPGAISPNVLDRQEKYGYRLL